MRYLISFICLLLGLTVSGQVAHVSYRLSAHYGARVDSFEREQPVDSTNIVMLGDSHTEFGGNWNERIGGVTNILNRGIIGDTAHGIQMRLSQILPGHPRAIFLLCGTNDISHGIGPKAVFNNLRQVIVAIRTQSPQTRLYVQSIPPLNQHFGRWKSMEGRDEEIVAVNSLLSNYCRDNGIVFIDMYRKFTRGSSNELIPSMSRDGLHFSELGYKVWAAQIRPYIWEANRK